MAKKTKTTYAQAQKVVREVLSQFGQKTNASTVREVAKKVAETVPPETSSPPSKKAA